MNKQERGGPAFPNSRHIGELMVVDGGMTLRDYFAAKAMQVVISNATVKMVQYEAIASAAYKMADAMITERNKGD